MTSLLETHSNGESETALPGLEQSPAPAPGVPASPLWGTIVVVYLVLLSALLIYALLVLWPTPTPAGGTAPTTSQVEFLWWSFPVADEVRLLLLVALTGAMGGVLHGLRSATWYIGHRNLKRNWLVTYATLPFVASTLSIIFYLVIRGGFFSPQATVQQTSPFGFAAMAGMIGLFSPQAVLKLKEIADIVLTKPPAGSDAQPQEPPPPEGGAPPQAHAGGPSAIVVARSPSGSGARPQETPPLAETSPPEGGAPPQARAGGPSSPEAPAPDPA